MPIPKKLVSYLTNKSLHHEIVPHKTVYTAFDVAATLRVPLTAIAKVLLLKSDKGFLIAVLSAGHLLDMKKIAKLAGAKKIRIPSEKELWAFLKKKKAALTSFGGYHKVPVFLDTKFSKNIHGFFPSGSFTESFRILLKHFVLAEKPTSGAFSIVRKKKIKKKTKKAIKKKR
ncbi:YbaK/EbsC family protein [Candidatus Uhrbacteria bacterium]|nr:YbaK/EbsC family protein [Candidatus Uhrbacteria bacterium]